MPVVLFLACTRGDRELAPLRVHIVTEITGGISSRQRFEDIQTHLAAYRTFELIAPIKNLSTSRSGLRKCGLSTDVTKLCVIQPQSSLPDSVGPRGRARRKEDKG